MNLRESIDRAASLAWTDAERALAPLLRLLTRARRCDDRESIRRCLSALGVAASRASRYDIGYRVARARAKEQPDYAALSSLAMALEDQGLLKAAARMHERSWAVATAAQRALARTPSPIRAEQLRTLNKRANEPRAGCLVFAPQRLSPWQRRQSERDGALWRSVDAAERRVVLDIDWNGIARSLLDSRPETVSLEGPTAWKSATGLLRGANACVVDPGGRVMRAPQGRTFWGYKWATALRRPDPHLDLAEAYVTLGDDAKARATLQSLLKEQPRNVEAIRVLAILDGLDAEG